MSKIRKYLITASLVISSCSFAEERTSADRFSYVGFEGGIVTPVKSKFKHKSSNTQITLKNSHMYSGKVGYSFYPRMALEFSATYQPSYRLSYVLPQTAITLKTPGKTKVASEIYMANFIYDFETYDGFTPFAILGAGLARIKIKETHSTLPSTNVRFFKVNKTTKSYPAWQVGLGVSKDLSDNFSLDVTAKLQVIHNIKINYEKLDPTTGRFVAQSPIKKTIGVGEFGIGFTYKLPF